MSPMAKSYLAANLGFMGLTILLFGLLMASLHTTSAQIGVCYGRNGNNLPPSREVVDMFNQYNIRRMRIYEPDPSTLEALRGSNIELMIGILNDKLQELAANQDKANSWVQNNVMNYHDVKFRYITVGNEVQPSDQSSAPFLVPAMEKIRNAIFAAGLGNQIKITTSIGSGTLGDRSFPPSKGYFKPEYRPVIDPVIRFLVSNQAPLLVSIYPYFSYDRTPSISLEYALFEAQNPVVSDPPYQYNNLFDALVDTVYAAVENTGVLNKAAALDSGGSPRLVVSESGWPSGGHGHRLTSTDAGTSTENARAYNQNLIIHVKGGRGTPRKPDVPIETYIFAMFDENIKQGDDVEKNFGLFYPNKQPKYQINFN
ncbi:hypothetical protein PTKIN_Ptkin06aG0165300 [Pterospermum kingtungense]